MIDYSKISRWLSSPIDPITVEDWVGNREFFGPDSEEELEMAYQIEKLLELDPKSPIVDQKEFLIIFPPEKKNNEVNLTYIGAKTEKIKINFGEVKRIDLDETGSLKIQIGKLTWTGAGKKLLFIAN